MAARRFGGLVPGAQPMFAAPGFSPGCSNIGSDMGSITPMLDQIETRTSLRPRAILADANHAKHACIRLCAERGVEALISVPTRSENAGPNADHDPAIVAWRERMETDEAKETYRARAGLCELSNARMKQHHGVAQLLIRGIENVTCVALLSALAQNVLSHAASLLT